MTGSAPNILIVGPAWVGDMVMAHCLVRLLDEQHEAPQIDMLAPSATASLGTRMAGVRAVVELDVGHGELALRRRRRLGRSLTGRYDQAIVLPNSFKSALVPWWARVPVRTGWVGERRVGVLNDRRRLDKQRYPLMIQRFMALGLEPGVELPRPQLPELTVDANNLDRLFAAHRLKPSAHVVVMCPGAEYGPAKRWPAGHFAAVARACVERGHQVWLVGSPNDQQICAEIAALVPAGLVNLAGLTTLLDAVDLLSVASRVVTNDSGLMHVACAVGCRVVAVFGSTSAEFTPPLGDDAAIVRTGIECSPCFRRSCPLGHTRCLNDLAPQRVLECL